MPSLTAARDAQDVKQIWLIKNKKEKGKRMTSYYIGLSLLSNNQGGTAVSRKNSRSEARRVLSLLEGRSIEDDEIAKGENGRPFFPDCHADFSISHSGNLAAVSLVSTQNRGGGVLRTGCDVQLVRPRIKMREIAEEYFHSAERDYIFTPGESSFDLTRFYQIWTLKECYIKLRGHSVFDMARVPSFIRGDAAFGPLPDRLQCNLYELADADGHYILAAAVEGDAELLPEIRWYSQSSLPCRSTAEIKAALSPLETVNPKR